MPLFRIVALIERILFEGSPDEAAREKLTEWLETPEVASKSDSPGKLSLDEAKALMARFG